LQEAWRQLTAAEDALIVNNNASATWLALRVLCQGREVLISRGQLVEIGGSFRLPEIFSEAGVRLREVGTTNRTRVADYAAAIGPETAALLRVHPSNYRLVGFAESPGIAELATLARERNLLCIDDIGSGCLIETTRLGLPAEPTFSHSIAAGADLVLGSGDKLLGGPQCGILLGRSLWIEQMRRHPLARCLRVDKLTLGALSGTLQSYLRGTAVQELPVLALLATPVADLHRRAEQIATAIVPPPGLTIETISEQAPVGGGSLPGAELPTAALRITGSVGAEVLAERLRQGTPRLFPRVQQGGVLVDLRSILPDDDVQVVQALRGLAVS
jgi:L-seryl-tRNA(Ser) seleniumtransferase